MTQPWPPMPPVRPTDDYYVIDRVAMENLLRVKTALYNAGAQPLTGDQIRDLANMMDANLGKAQGITEHDLHGGAVDALIPPKTDPAEEKILEALRTYTDRTGAQLVEMTGLMTGDLYPALLRLEEAGKITGHWEDMTPPRRRRYRIADYAIGSLPSGLLTPIAPRR